MQWKAPTQVILKYTCGLWIALMTAWAVFMPVVVIGGLQRCFPIGCFRDLSQVEIRCWEWQQVEQRKFFLISQKIKTKTKKNMELRWTETNYFEFFLTNQSVVRLRNNFAINIKFSESCKHVMNKKWFSNIFHQVRETWRLKWWISLHQTNDE